MGRLASCACKWRSLSERPAGLGNESLLRVPSALQARRSQAAVSTKAAELGKSQGQRQHHAQKPVLLTWFSMQFIPALLAPFRETSLKKHQPLRLASLLKTMICL